MRDAARLGSGSSRNAAQFGHDPAILRRCQRRDHFCQRCRPSGSQVIEQRRNAVAQLARQHGPIALLGQQVDIQIAQFVGELVGKLPVSPQPPRAVSREDAFHLSQSRARPPQRHPVVVHKLGVDILHQVRLVDLDDLQLSPQQRLHRLVGAHSRVQLHHWFGLIPARLLAGRLHHGVIKFARRQFDRPVRCQQLSDVCQITVVAAHRLQPDERCRRFRCPLQD